MRKLCVLLGLAVLLGSCTPFQTSVKQLDQCQFNASVCGLPSVGNVR